MGIQSNSSGEKIDFSKAKDVISSLLNLFKTPSAPAIKVDKYQVLTTKLRPGLSPTKISAEIIKRQTDAGAIPIGIRDDGSENMSEKMERIRVDVIVKAIIRDARITVTIDPGALIQGTGGNGGGPITVVGQTLTIASGTGLIQ